MVKLGCPETQKGTVQRAKPRCSKFDSIGLILIESSISSGITVHFCTLLSSLAKKTVQVGLNYHPVWFKKPFNLAKKTVQFG